MSTFKKHFCILVSFWICRLPKRLKNIVVFKFHFRFNDDLYLNSPAVFYYYIVLISKYYSRAFIYHLLLVSIMICRPVRCILYYEHNDMFYIKILKYLMPIFLETDVCNIFFPCMYIYIYRVISPFVVYSLGSRVRLFTCLTTGGA